MLLHEQRFDKAGKLDGHERKPGDSDVSSDTQPIHQPVEQQRLLFTIYIS